MKSAPGPALGGAEAKWDSKENLYSWIRNSPGNDQKGHPRAVELWNQYKLTVMTAFPQFGLTMRLLQFWFTSRGFMTDPILPKKGGLLPGSCRWWQKDNTWFYTGIAVFLALLSYLLSLIIGNLNKLAAAQSGETYQDKSLWEKLTSKSMISFLIFLPPSSWEVIPPLPGRRFGKTTKLFTWSAHQIFTRHSRLGSQQNWLPVLPWWRSQIKTQRNSCSQYLYELSQSH